MMGDSPVTEKQLQFIEAIQEFTDYDFTGTTKQEASIFIDAHINEFKLRSANNWSIENGYF